MTKCEWCAESYPNGTWDEHFWSVKLYGTTDHTICDCCYKHLKKKHLLSEQKKNEKNNM